MFTVLYFGDKLRLIKYILFFTVLISSAISLNSGAYYNLDTQLSTALVTSNDPNGILSLSPYGQNGMYFTDEDYDGMYGLNIVGIPRENGQIFENVFRIVNNFNISLDITLIDNGTYSDNVTFKDGATDLESAGKTLFPGSALCVDIYVDAESIDKNVALINSFTINCHNNDQVVMSLSREALLQTVDGTYLTLLDHNGSGLSGGNAQYYATSWNDVSGETNTDGKLILSTQESYTKVRMYCNHSYEEQTLSELESSNYSWQTGALHYVGTGSIPAQVYINSQWHDWNGKDDLELFPGIYIVEFKNKRTKTLSVYSGSATNVRM